MDHIQSPFEKTKTEDDHPSQHDDELRHQQQKVQHSSCSSPPQSPASSSLHHHLQQQQQQQYGTCSPTISSTTTIQYGALSTAYPNIIIPTTTKTTTNLLAAAPLPTRQNQFLTFSACAQQQLQKTTATTFEEEDSDGERIKSPAATTRVEDSNGDRRRLEKADTTHLHSKASFCSSPPTTKTEDFEDTLQKNRRKQSYPTRCDDEKPKFEEKPAHYANNGIAPLLLERLENVARAAFGGLPEFAGQIPSSTSLNDLLATSSGTKTSAVGQPSQQLSALLTQKSTNVDDNKFCHICIRQFSTSTYLRKHLAIKHEIGQRPENYNTKKHSLQQQQQKLLGNEASFKVESSNSVSGDENEGEEDDLSTSSDSNLQQTPIAAAFSTQTELVSQKLPSVVAHAVVTEQSKKVSEREAARQRQQRRRARQAVAAAAAANNATESAQQQHQNNVASISHSAQKLGENVPKSDASPEEGGVAGAVSANNVANVPDVQNLIQQLSAQQQQQQNISVVQPPLQSPIQTTTAIVSTTAVVPQSLVSPLLTTLLNMNPNILASLLQQQQKLKQQQQQQFIAASIPATTQQLMPNNLTSTSHPTTLFQQQQIVPSTSAATTTQQQHEAVLSRLQAILGSSQQQNLNSVLPSLLSDNLKLPLDAILERFRGSLPQQLPPSFGATPSLEAVAALSSSTSSAFTSTAIIKATTDSTNSFQTSFAESSAAISTPLTSIAANLPPNLLQQLNIAALIQQQQQLQNGQQPIFFPPSQMPPHSPWSFSLPSSIDPHQLVPGGFPPGMFPNSSSGISSALIAGHAGSLAPPHTMLPPMMIQFPPHLPQPNEMSRFLPPSHQQLNHQPPARFGLPPQLGLDLPNGQQPVDSNMPKDLQRFRSPTSSSSITPGGPSTQNSVAAIRPQIFRCGECGVDFPSKFILECHKQQAHGIDPRKRIVSGQNHVESGGNNSGRTSRRTTSEADGGTGALSPFSGSGSLGENEEEPGGDTSNGQQSRKRPHAKRSEQQNGPKRVVNPFKVDPEAFCEICRIEVCSKYFLKIHKQNLHNIPLEVQNSVEMRAERERVLEEMRREVRTRAMAEQLKQVAHSLNADVTNPAQMATLAASLPPQPPMRNIAKNFCNCCMKEVCNKYFLTQHMRKMHGIIIEDEPGRRRRRGGNAKKRTKGEEQQSTMGGGIHSHSSSTGAAEGRFSAETNESHVSDVFPAEVAMEIETSSSMNTEDENVDDKKSLMFKQEQEGTVFVKQAERMNKYPEMSPNRMIVACGVETFGSPAGVSQSRSEPIPMPPDQSKFSGDVAYLTEQHNLFKLLSNSNLNLPPPPPPPPPFGTNNIPPPQVESVLLNSEQQHLLPEEQSEDFAARFAADLPQEKNGEQNLEQSSPLATATPSSSSGTSETSESDQIRKAIQQEFTVKLMSNCEQPPDSYISKDGGGWIRADDENGGQELLSHVLPALSQSLSSSSAFDAAAVRNVQSDYRVTLPVRENFTQPVMGNVLLVPVRKRIRAERQPYKCSEAS